MTEKVTVNGKEVWVVVEPLVVHRQNNQIIPTEYFIAYHNDKEPDEKDVENPGEMIREQDGKPKLFLSPVAALEYVCEKV